METTVNTKNNQRFQETDARIVDAFIGLIEDRSQEVDRVTVSAICRACCINRASFYLHYKDVPDLMDGIDTQLADYYGSLFSEHASVRSLGETFVLLFSFIRDHKSFYRTYLARQSSFRIMEVALTPTADSHLHPVTEARGIKSEAELTYHLLYFRNGLLAIIREWLRRDCAETPEELAEILGREYTPVPDIFGRVPAGPMDA